MISIVMSYCDRPQQLYVTLKSIRCQNVKDLEIIIVDDGSSNQLSANNVVNNFRELNIKVIEIDKADKWWINPCMPFNIGFRNVTGNTVIIQNPECIHIGPVIDTALNSINDSSYLTFSCFAATKQSHAHFANMMTVEDSIIGIHVPKFVLPFKANISANTAAENCWYNHPTIHPTGYHFLSVITKKNLDDLGGFDERYAAGYCWDDNEFLCRIKKKGLNVRVLDPSPAYIIHQWHGKTKYHGGCSEWHKNKDLYERMTKVSPSYKVNG